MKLVEIKNIKLGYGGESVVSGLSFSILEGDFICIVGPNGSGKTTLIKGILGLLPLMGGKITFGDEVMSRKSIGYIPQETEVDPNFPASVFEIVLTGALNETRNFYNASVKKRAEETLDLVGIKNLKNKGFFELSGGERQKVLLARALMATKKLLILDEPSNNLDQKSRKELYRLITKLNREQKIAIVMITHDLDHDNLIGDKILSLERGLGTKGYFFGTTKEFVRKVHHE